MLEYKNMFSFMGQYSYFSNCAWNYLQVTTVQKSYNLKRWQLLQSLKSLLPVDSGTPFLTKIIWEAVVKDTTILLRPYVFDNNWFAVVQFGL